MKKIILPLLTLLLITACTKKYDEINTNPNEITSTTSAQLLAGVIKDITITTQYDIGFIMSGRWSQVIVGLDFNTGFDMYETHNQDFDGCWRQLYAILTNTNQLIKQAQEENNPTLEGIALVLKAYTGQTIVDLWGDVPWAEAGNGFDENPIFTPSYDNQQDIYRSIINDLETAAKKIELEGGEVYRGDILYDGNKTKWLKFTNSLLVRILNRVSKTSLADESKLKVLLNSGNIFEDNSENASLFFDEFQTGNFNYQNYEDSKSKYTFNPIFDELIWSKQYTIGKPTVDMLLARGEDVNGRLPMYCEKKDSLYVGAESGLYAWGSETSNIAFSYQDDPTSPLHLITYPEIEFIKAEYENRNGNTVAAENAYQSAITASFDMYGLTVPVDYFNHPLVKFSLVYPPEQAIMEQKYLALWLQGNEAFNEHRRTGYPNLPMPYLANQPSFPTKFPYPQIEIDRNSENVKSTVLSEMNNKIFWDVD